MDDKFCVARHPLLTLSAARRLHDRVPVTPDHPKPGVLFRDVSPLCSDPRCFRTAIETLSMPFTKMKVTHVGGVESRGFGVAGSMANNLDAGFLMIRKANGKLPPPTHRVEYELEYGTAALELRHGIVGPGDRVVVADDVVAKGGSASAAAEVVRGLGAEVVGFAFFIALAGLGGVELLKRTGLPVEVLLTY